MIKYKIGLCSVWWGRDDVDIRAFDSIDEQTVYFVKKVGGLWSNPLNLIMRNNVNPTISYTDDNKRDIYTVLKFNYCVIGRWNEEDPNNIEYRYYYINNINHLGGYTYSIELDLDDYQSNFVGKTWGISDCIIRRAHLDRWSHDVTVDTDGNKIIKYNTSLSSPLYVSEGLPTTSKRLIRRTKLSLEPDLERDGDNTLNKWFSDNILCWEYVYLVRDHKYNIKQIDGSGTAQLDMQPIQSAIAGAIDVQRTTTSSSKGLSGVLCCICAPVYAKQVDDKNDTSDQLAIKTSDTNSIYITRQGIEQFLDSNNNTSYVLARKMSIKPPLPVDSYDMVTSLNYEYGHSTYLQPDSTYNTLYMCGSSEDSTLVTTRLIASGTMVINTGSTTVGGSPKQLGVIYKTLDVDEVYTQLGSAPLTRYYLTTNSFDFSKKLTYKVNDIITGEVADKTLNPKLLTPDCYEINISINGQSYTYNYLQLGTESNKVRYTEALTPDVTRAYARMNDLSGVYIPETADNLTGLVTSEDNSLMVDNDQLSAMLAQNKNYYLQNSINIGGEIMGSIGKIATGNIGAGLSGLVGAGKAALDIGLTTDNMRQAPNSVSNANGSAYQAVMVAAPAIYLEEYDILDIDAKTLNDYIHKYGYKYGKIDKISKYTHIRKWWDYLECEVDSIRLEISNIEKMRLKERLRSIRLWHADILGDEYQRENYERWIDGIE